MGQDMTIVSLKAQMASSHNRKRQGIVVAF